MKLRIYKDRKLWFLGYGGGIINPAEIPCLTFNQAVRAFHSLRGVTMIAIARSMQS